MDNIVEGNGDFKAIGRLPISATAKYVGTIMCATGARSVADVCAITGLPKSTVYRAHNEFIEHGFDLIPTSLTVLTGEKTENSTILTIPASENPTIPTDEKITGKTVSPFSPVRISEPEPSCARDITTRATKELPSEVSYLNNNIPPTPQKQKPKPEFGRTQALEAFHAYNDTALVCAIPQASRMTPDRERKIIARLKEFGLDGWHRALANIKTSPFLKGEGGDGKWRASLDFLLQASSFAKVHDGAYSSDAARKSTAPQSPPRIRCDDDWKERIALEMIEQGLTNVIN
ncbi:hypothetical protein DLM45_02410 [Hyphomicrobium methylovorum]|uniref:helix-turn-helix domain-containing protein n=1 Tax=Hyphomicrobium methylovorum TaxID=84 RepID=UPI0015E7A3E4|nr:helix-turn-helix domain-containing protein [Hyphomicrobium methylovorum]MBA2125079.1 hypothetical protein [Hyphomicrobium methylovorum]